MTSGWFERLRPAYSLRAHVHPSTARTLIGAMLTAPGRLVVTSHAIDPDTGLQSITIDTDGPLTHHQVKALLRDRFGPDLIHLADPALTTAATGKITQRLCVPTTEARDLALLDHDADHRVITHLLLDPDGIDTYTGRRRRVALLSNATAVHDFGSLPAPMVLPALESTAVHLRATGRRQARGARRHRQGARARLRRDLPHPHPPRPHRRGPRSPRRQRHPGRGHCQRARHRHPRRRTQCPHPPTPTPGAGGGRPGRGPLQW
ncbi:hypothetical protein [Kitasatospora sp. Root107]|uniref:hypothetical protein n=1 Tax=Kitasatospora sp. Root107 TaxID=1736424 RepID=UPI0012FC3C21|nr:hypothetical protein [Kitasatospora sp. Root107]